MLDIEWCLANLLVYTSGLNCRSKEERSVNCNALKETFKNSCAQLKMPYVLLLITFYIFNFYFEL